MRWNFEKSINASHCKHQRFNIGQFNANPGNKVIS